MPAALDPIPLEVPITTKDGAITSFFRLRWQQLIDAAIVTPTRARPDPYTGHVAIVTTALLTPVAAGTFRISYYVRKTAADGAGSSLTFTWGWTESGVPLTESDAALTLDTTGAQRSGSKVVDADGSADLTFALAYASTTPAFMAYRLRVVVEQLA